MGSCGLLRLTGATFFPYSQCRSLHHRGAGLTTQLSEEPGSREICRKVTTPSAFSTLTRPTAHGWKQKPGATQSKQRSWASYSCNWPNHFPRPWADVSMPEAPGTQIPVSLLGAFPPCLTSTNSPVLVSSVSQRRAETTKAHRAQPHLHNSSISGLRITGQPCDDLAPQSRVSADYREPPFETAVLKKEVQCPRICRQPAQQPRVSPPFAFPFALLPPVLVWTAAAMPERSISRCPAGSTT